MSRPSGASVMLDEVTRQRRYRMRRFRDALSRWVVVAGGVGVIISLVLIFVYLFTEVAPMLMAARAERVAEYPRPGEAAPAALAVDRLQSLGFRLDAEGGVQWFRPATGEITSAGALPLPEGVQVTATAAAEARHGLHVLGLSDGRVLVVENRFVDTFPRDRIVIEPALDFPLGEAPLTVDPDGRPLVAVAIQRGLRGLAIGALTDDGRLIVLSYQTREDLLAGETLVVPRGRQVLPPAPSGGDQIWISGTLNDLFLLDPQGIIHHYRLARTGAPRLLDSHLAFDEPGVTITASGLLAGATSVVIGGSDGSVSQWFVVRDGAAALRLARIRTFGSHAAPVTAVGAEQGRKGFATGDAGGGVRIHHATAHRTVLETQAPAPVRALAFAPRNDGLLAESGAGRAALLAIDNPHPEVALSALWSRIWYESHDEPDYIWQSSSATDEFEPKFSLVPLTVGTLKAAFYAMLFAMPLAIMGAIYSAYFMSRRMRGFTKPAIELIEALPTVILGFLAGLWFAPYVEQHLPALFSILVLMPVGILAAAWGWSRLPVRIRGRVGVGWEAAILVPVVLAIGWLCLASSPWMELWWFGGDMRQWLTDMGINYEQRNALIVGVAMGFAVIPTIYSIAEDAIFNVPRQLTQGSLALGATPWQTMTRVVLLTASPGIFAALMIGFGRAIGETMIVLMATGNSPIVNFNIFEGLRTLSANIAVEMPEAEVGGTHYRILFLSALVLFVFTFVVNTVAELVRQRLRKKYASI